jgi:YcfA-like protein.
VPNRRLPPSAPQNKVVKVLLYKGFEIRSKTKSGKGSHINLKKEGVQFVITVPHGKVSRGTLMNILKRAGISRDEFIELLSKV